MNKENEKIKELFNLYNNAKFDEALSLGIFLSKEYISNPVIFNILGAIYLGINDKKNALINFNKAIELFPDFVEAYNNIANIYKDLNRYEESLIHYDKALRINPNFIIAHLNKGNALMNLGKYHDAIYSYQKAINLDPKFVEAYNNLGNVMEYLNKNEEAIDNYKKAINLNPKFVQAYHNLARLFINLDKRNEAIDIFKNLLSMFPDDPIASHSLAALKGRKESNSIKEYTKNLYDSRAGFFETLVSNKLEYDAPNELVNLLKENFKGTLRFNNAIDLGCGTGLSGLAFKKYIDYLLGIDLSKNMIDVARNKEIYNELIVGDLNDIIKDQVKLYDLIISTDVFIYLGNLDDLFKNIKKISNKDALFIFSTEFNTGDNYKLNFSGRYSHSHDYINKILKVNSFKLIGHKIGNLRKEKDKWIKGGFYIASS